MPETQSAGVELLYTMCEIIDSSDKPETCVTEYMNILKGFQGVACDRKLALQLICRYVYKFPNQLTESMRVVWQLCQDADQEVRKYAFKMLPTLLNGCGEAAAKLSELFIMLLKTNDSEEQLVAEKCLFQLLSAQGQAVLGLLLSCTFKEEAADYRQAVIKILQKHLLHLKAANKLTKEIQQEFAKSLSQALTVVDGDQFLIVVRMLKSLPVCEETPQKQAVFQLIINEAQLDLPVDVEHLEQIRCCLTAAQQFISDDVPTDKVVPLILGKVFPAMIMPDAAQHDVLSDILRITAEYLLHCKRIEEPERFVELVLTLIKNRCPSATNVKSLSDLPDIRITDVEALLIIFLMLVKSGEEGAFVDKLNQLRVPLLHLCQLLQNCSTNTAADEKLDVKGGAPLDAKRLRDMALRSTDNIKMILRGVKFVDATPKLPVRPSWLQVSEAVNKGVRQPAKQTLPAAARSQRKPKSPLSRYIPPIGRYSSAVDFSYAGNGFRGSSSRGNGLRGNGPRGNGRRGRWSYKLK